MRFVRVAVLTAGLGWATAGGAAAQVVVGGGGGAGGGTAATTTPTTAGGGATSSTTSSTSNGGASLGSVDTGLAATPAITGATIQGISSTTAASGGVLDRSNFLGGTYVNPYTLGVYSNPTGTTAGFGSQLFGTGGGGGFAGSTTSTASRTTSAGRTTTGTAAGTGNPFGTSTSPFGTGGTTGTGGRTTQGGRGGQFGAAGGFGGAAAGSQFGGQVIPLPRNIAYQAVLRFPTPTVAPAQRLADVQAVIGRSTMLANPAGVTVVQDGTALVLRGQVASEDDARLAEGMVRLTPGVREVRNELTYPVQ
jgi:hypothetical protein